MTQEQIITLYKTDTGEIVGYIKSDIHTGINVGNDPKIGGVVGNYHQGLYYVDVSTGEAKPRTIIDVSVSKTTIVKAIEEITFTGSAGCKLILDDQTYELETDLEFSAEDPGEYTLTFEKWPFLPKTIKVTVE